jgi:hypothetical protein
MSISVSTLKRIDAPAAGCSDAGSRPAPPQDKVQGEFRPVIGLHLADGKREALPDLLEEGQAAELLLLARQPQHPEPRAIVQHGVLKQVRWFTLTP